MNGHDIFTLRIQLIAMAPGVTLLWETPTELSKVLVVNTPIAPPKKCWIMNKPLCFAWLLEYQITSKSWLLNISSTKYLQSPPGHVRYIWRSNTVWKPFRHNIRSYECHYFLQRIPQYTSFFKVLNYDHLEQISINFHMPLNKAWDYAEQNVQEASVNSIPFFWKLGT